MSVPSDVTDEFRRRFGSSPPFVARAPGRVNLIGEHTDYNDGLVLPMAIDREISIAVRPRDDATVLLHSLDFDETAAISLAHLGRGDHGWAEYLKGVAWVVQERAPIVNGWDGVVVGDVPRGAGLASSAALELAIMRAFAVVNQMAWKFDEVARAGQRVENEWIGVQSGVMDQLVVASAQEGHAMLIDCRSLVVHHVPVPDHVSVVVLDTTTRRSLGDTAYNQRRQQCEAAAELLGVVALRDVTLGQLDAHTERMSDTLYRRARHVVTENARTVAAAHALRIGDVVELGRLMNASHASLRDDFEVTNAALDLIVDLAQSQPACFGARMTGAGFGGCAVAIVETARVDQFTIEVTRDYQARIGLEARVYVCRAVNGVSAADARY